MAIEDNEIERLKEIFVTRQECQKTNDEIEKKLGYKVRIIADTKGE